MFALTCLELDGTCLIDLNSKFKLSEEKVLSTVAHYIFIVQTYRMASPATKMLIQ